MATGDSQSLSTIISTAGAFSKDQSPHDRVVSLYEANRDSVYRFLVSQGLKPSIAQEVTQDVFVKLFIALQRGSEITLERGWLYGVAAKSAVDYWRREGKHVWVELDTGSTLAEALVCPEPGPEATAIQNQRALRAANALLTLPSEQRLCVQLRSEGLLYKEIADILGVAVSTIADWLSTAVDRLQRAVHD